MRVFFAFSTQDLPSHLVDYQKIVNSINKLGHELTVDLIKKAKRTKREWGSSSEKTNWDAFRKEAIGGIEEADAVISEVSLPSSGAGFQVAYALMRKKPVLILFSRNFGQHKPSKVIEAFESPLLRINSYDNNDLHGVIKNFFLNLPNQTLVKFNFLITPEINQYIDWLHRTTRKSKSEALRLKIIEEIIETDEEYRAYIKSGIKEDSSGGAGR